MTKKSFMVFAAAITMLTASQCFADSFKIYDFNLSESNRMASISWVSENDKNYVVEEADSLNGAWSVASGGECKTADDFLSSAIVSISPPSNQSKFYRVREIDAEGPKISFAIPSKDAISVPLTSTISVNLTDDSGVSFDAITMFIDDVDVNASNLSWDGMTLTYTSPTGSIGTNGQEVVIRVVASDALGNETEGISNIILNQPLSVTASSVLYIGDPGLGTYSYLTVNSVRTDKNDIILTSIDNDSMTISGATSMDLQEGLCFLSLIPTNIFYRKALSVSLLDGNSYYVATTNINASDIFIGNFSTDYQKCSIYGDDGLPIMDDNLRTRSVMATSLHGATNITKYIKLGGHFAENYQSDAKKYGFGLDTEISCKLLGSFSASGRLDPLNKNNDDLELFFQGELLFDFESGISFARAMDAYENKKNITLSKIPIGVGPGLWIELNLDGYVYLALEAAIEGRISTGAEVGCGFCFHRKRKAGAWYAYDDNWTDWYADKKPISFDIDGKASARVGAGIKITAFFESLIGPFVSGGPFIEGAVAYGHNFQDNSQHLRKTVIAGGEVEAGVDARFVNISSLGSKILHKDIYIVLYEDDDIVCSPGISFPEEIIVTNGDSVIISPVVSGTEPITYLWYKNGVPIGITKRALEFVATKQNGGIYSVEAVNIAGKSNASTRVNVVTDFRQSVVGTWKWNEKWNYGSGSSNVVNYLYITPELRISKKEYVTIIVPDWKESWMNNLSGVGLIAEDNLTYELQGKAPLWWSTRNESLKIESGRRIIVETSPGHFFTATKISNAP